MNDFSGKIVLITGPSGNLGRAVAEAFFAAGATLVLADRHVDELAAILPAIVSAPDRCLVHPVDLTDRASVSELVQAAIARFGQIDAVITTVGGYRAGTPVHETPLDTWDFMLNLNARTVLLLAQAVIPSMLERGSGKFVSVAARAGLSGSANMGAYSVSKSAVIRLTESMAAELRHQGINVNCVLPGTIDTPQNREAMPDADVNRWVAPEAIADVIVFLASDAARAIHGAAVPVYGRS